LDSASLSAAADGVPTSCVVVVVLDAVGAVVVVGVQNPHVTRQLMIM
jgi:hypothetical protein